MADLIQSAVLFEVSARLQSAASSLMRIARGETADSEDRKSLIWASRFLAQVDWTSGIEPEPGINGGLTVSATNTRPKFYASLVKITSDFQIAGINSEKGVYSFLKDTYRLLKSGGEDKDDLQREKILLASKLFTVLSESIIVELSNNGLPKQPTTLTIGEYV